MSLDLSIEERTDETEQEAPEFAFATVVAVGQNGVQLQFDGADAAGEKLYPCNISQVFRAGDRVKILHDSGTVVVEYVLGSPGARLPLPNGGTTGQVLKKASNNPQDVAWGDAAALPSGGSAGNVLKKTSSGAEWGTVREVPDSGTTGHVLTKTASGYSFSAAPAAANGLPTGGSSGQVLTKNSSTNYSAIWSTPPVNGGSSSIGFMGKTATAKKTVSNIASTASATTSSVAQKVNDLLTALRDYGLIN